MSPADREYIVQYAIGKAVRDKQHDIAIAIGQIYLSVDEGDYATIIKFLCRICPGEHLRLEEQLQQSVVYSNSGFNIIAGQGNNIYIKLQIPDLETLAISEPAPLSANASIEEISLWFRQQIYFNFKQNIELLKTCRFEESVNILVANIDANMGKIIAILIKQLCGIECSASRPKPFPQVNNRAAIRYSLEIPFGSGKCQFVVNISPSIAFEQFEIIINNRMAYRQIQGESLCNGIGFQVLQKYGKIFVEFNTVDLQQILLSQPDVCPSDATFDQAQSYIRNYILIVFQDLSKKQRSIKGDESDFSGLEGSKKEDKDFAEDCCVKAAADRGIILAQTLKNFLIELLMIRNENGVLVSFGAIASWVLSFLLGITVNDPKVVKSQSGSLSGFDCNDNNIEIKAVLPFYLEQEGSNPVIGKMEILVRVQKDIMGISIEQFEIIVTDQEACSLIRRKIASPELAELASQHGIFTPSPGNSSQLTLAPQPNSQPHPP